MRLSILQDIMVPLLVPHLVTVMVKKSNYALFLEALINIVQIKILLNGTSKLLTFKETTTEKQWCRPCRLPSIVYHFKLKVGMGGYSIVMIIDMYLASGTFQIIDTPCIGNYRK